MRKPSTVAHRLRTEAGARLCDSFARGSLTPFSTPLATSREPALGMTYWVCAFLVKPYLYTVSYYLLLAFSQIFKTNEYVSYGKTS